MQKFCIVFVASLFLAVASACAASLSIKFTNMSGDSIETLTATSKDATEMSVQNILASPIASGEIGEATIEASENTCVFKLRFTFASGKTLERPDTDLCQTDSIVVE